MGKFDHKKIMPRYSAIAIILSIIAIAVICKAFYIMTAKNDYWMKVADRVKKDSVEIKPMRGNILSCNGQLMASSLPEFKVFMDFNHQLAGETVRYSGFVQLVRDATPEELQPKHHGCGCGCDDCGGGDCGHDHGDGCNCGGC